MFKLRKIKWRWLPADILIGLDVLQNTVNHTAYDAIGGYLGCDPAFINSITSMIELARFVMLAHNSKP